MIDDHDRYHNPQKHSRDNKPLAAIKKDSGFYLTTFIADHAIECLQEHATQYPEQPFFHCVTFTAPHFPLHALPQDIAKYAQTYTVGWDAIRQSRSSKQQSLGLIGSGLSELEPSIGPPYDFPEAIKKLGAGEVNRELPWSDLTEAQKSFQAAKMAVHAAMIDRMDIEIGRILQQLKSMNKFDDTLIMFLSDNGASAEIMVRGDGHDSTAAVGSADTFACLGPGWSKAANTPFRRHKTWVHEGGISTSMIAHWPRGIRARNEIRSRPCHVIDIVPTILELAGGPWPSNVKDQSAIPADLRGESFLDCLAGTQAGERKNPLWWLHEDNKALLEGHYKLVAAKGEPWQLYDLSSDRTEMHDLAQREPELVKRLSARWEAMLDEMKNLRTKTK